MKEWSRSPKENGASHPIARASPALLFGTRKLWTGNLDAHFVPCSCVTRVVPSLFEYEFSEGTSFVLRAPSGLQAKNLDAFGQDGGREGVQLERH